MAWKVGMGFLGVNVWSRRFFGFCWKPQGFFGISIFPPLDQPHYLKSRVTPLGGEAFL